MKPGGEWHVDMLPSAYKELSALRDPMQNRIRKAIRSLSEDPTPSDSIAMRGKGVGLHRLRVGNYRVVYRIQAQRVRVLIIRIGHRSEVYQGFEAR